MLKQKQIEEILAKTKPDPNWIEELSDGEYNEKLLTWSNIVLAFYLDMGSPVEFLDACNYDAEELKGI